MIFFQSYPPQIQGISNLSYKFILLNGYYIVTITGVNGTNGTIIFNQTIPDFTMNVILVGGGGAGGANAVVYDSYGSIYVGGGGGAGGATLQTTLSSSVGQISVNIGAGGISNTTTPTTPTTPTSTSITYGSTTLTANPGANGGNAVNIPPADTDNDEAVFTGGSGGVGVGGGGSGGDGFGASDPALATNGTSVDINGITYCFGGGGAGGGDDESEYGGTQPTLFGTGGLGGGGGNYNGSTVNTGYEYIYTYKQNPPNPAPLIVDTSDPNALFSNNGLPNSGGGGAGADALIDGSSTEITPGYNGGSGVLILYFPATN
jgi:hypothetical protein